MNFFAMRVARRFLGRFFWPFMVGRFVFKLVRANKGRKANTKRTAGEASERHYDYEAKR